MNSEILCLHPVAIFKFVEKTKGKEKVDDIIADIVDNEKYMILDITDGLVKPITYDYLMNAENWISNDLSLHVFTMAADVIGGERPIHHAGKNIVRAKIDGTKGMLLRASASMEPKIILASLKKRYRQFNRTKHVQVIKVEKNKWIMRHTHYPHIEIHKYICDYNEGCIEGALGSLFVDFSISETSCQVLGDKFCEFEMRWRKQNKWNNFISLIRNSRRYNQAVELLDRENDNNQKMIIGLERAVEERTKELLKKQEQLELANKTQTQFISDSSHELRTPLAIAKGKLDVLKMRGIDDKEKFQEDFNLIGEEIYRMSRIISNLHVLTQDDENNRHLPYRKVSLHILLDSVYNKVSVLAENENIDLQLFIKEEAFVKCNPDDLERVFLNIIENALHYNKENGGVYVSLTVENNFAKVTISDTGKGIATEELKNIFNRFYRIDKTHEIESGGSGLGLSIAEAIINNHEGKITVESELGVGSEFVIWLPLF
ncbi:MAG: ATP-binding protein [bacterium]|nr:ATP-binding protein [bacterium]